MPILKFFYYRLSASHLHLTCKQCCPILSTFRFRGLTFCMLQNQQQKIFIIWSRKPQFRCSPPSKANIRFIFNIEKDPVLVECIWVWVCITERERERERERCCSIELPISKAQLQQSDVCTSHLPKYMLRWIRSKWQSVFTRLSTKW